MEKAFYIEGEARLFAMRFEPEREQRRTMGFVLVHPFAEEKKSAHRTLVCLARCLCGEGFPVLMFDLRGCGDSEGDFMLVRLADWITDLERAVQMLRQEAEVQSVGMIGLRFGAYLSGYYAAEHHNVTHYIWIEPVLKPLDYLRRSLRHKLVKELLTEGKVVSNREELLQNLDNEQGIDFDGFEIRTAFFRDLREAQTQEVLLSAFPVIPLGLLVSVSMNGKMAKAVLEAAMLKPEVQLKQVNMELFWNRVEDVDCEELMTCIMDYLGEKEDE